MTLFRFVSLVTQIVVLLASSLGYTLLAASQDPPASTVLGTGEPPPWVLDAPADVLDTEEPPPWVLDAPADVLDTGRLPGTPQPDSGE